MKDQDRDATIFIRDILDSVIVDNFLFIRT